MKVPVLITENRKTDAIQRLSRIEGQGRGVERMMEEDRRCVDVLAQVASIQEALRGLTKVRHAQLSGTVRYRCESL